MSLPLIKLGLPPIPGPHSNIILSKDPSENHWNTFPKCQSITFKSVTVFWRHRRLIANLRDWSIITGRGGGGYKMEKSQVRNFFRPPPLLVSSPLLKDGNFLHPPPPPRLKLQAPQLKLPQTFCAPPPSFNMSFPPHPLCVQVKLHLLPPPPIL